jgi:hypothetical protein
MVLVFQGIARIKYATLPHSREGLPKSFGKAGGPGWTDGQIAEALDVGLSTVWRVRQRFVEEGTEAAITPKPGTRVYARKLDGAGEAQAMLAGFDVHVAKPVEPGELMAVVSRLARRTCLPA